MEKFIVNEIYKFVIVENMKFVISTLSIIILSSLLAFSQDEAEHKLDSESDSLQIRHIDTLKVYPLKNHGSLSYDTSSHCNINIKKSDVNFDNFYSVSDIIAKRIFAYNYQMGFPGQISYLTANGSSPRDLLVKYNGNPIFTPKNSYSDIDLISNEFFEQIEIYQGSYASILSGRTNLVNFTEKRYNSAKPYTKMWYTQSGYGVIGADGLFSQNIHPRLNIAIGFHNIAGDGRYQNSAIENWNTRAVLRYNSSDKSSLSITYNFNNKKQGRNGGLNLDDSQEPSNELQAIVNYNYFKERIFRNDISLTYSNLLDSIGNSYLLLNAFYSTISTEERFKREPKLLQLDSSGKFDHSSNYFGANAFIETKLFDWATVRSGAELMSMSVGKTLLKSSESFFNYNAFVLADFPIGSSFKASGGLRYDRSYARNTLHFGGRLTYLSTDFLLYSDFSRSQILPSVLQGLDRNIETHYLGIVGMELKSHNLKSSIFYRRVINPLLAKLSFDKNYIVYSDNCDCLNRDIFGLEIVFSPNLYKSFGTELKLDAYYSQTNEKIDYMLPNFIVEGKLFYEYTVGKSIMRGGVEGMLMGPFKGQSFYPITQDFISSDKKSGLMGNGANAFVSLRLGNAFLRISFDNLFNQYYYYTAGYPMPDRMFHLSLTWAFND